MSSILKHIILIIFFGALCASTVIAQSGISLVYSPAKVLKHRDNLKFDVPSLTQEYRIAYTQNTSEDQDWSRYWNSPIIVINGTFVDFGNTTLGHAYSILPELHFPLFRKSSFVLDMQFGTGIAYLDSPFDAIDNPNNNAIGSRLNNTTSLKFGLNYKWSYQFSSGLSAGLVHFSNGLSSSPNSGINIYGASLNLKYAFTPKTESALTGSNLLLTEEVILTPFRRWVLDAQFQYGFTEHSTPDGPKYSVRTAALAAGYRYTPFMTILSGLEFEYNHGIYVFHKLNFFTEDESKQRAKRLMAYVENEFRYGRVFNRLRLGFYLKWPTEFTKTNYVKVTTGIYLPFIDRYTRPYIAVTLKTHSAIADFLGVTTGLLF